MLAMSARWPSLDGAGKLDVCSNSGAWKLCAYADVTQRLRRGYERRVIPTTLGERSPHHAHQATHVEIRDVRDAPCSSNVMRSQLTHDDQGPLGSVTPPGSRLVD